MYSKIKKISVLIVIPTLILVTTFTGSNFIPTYAAPEIPKTNEIVSAPQDIAISVSFNTQKEEVVSMLGTTITAITVEGPLDLPVVWACDTYDPTVPLAHIFEGTLGPLSGNVANSANVKARATINVADVSQGDYTTDFGTVTQERVTISNNNPGTYISNIEVTGAYSFELSGGIGLLGVGYGGGIGGNGAKLNAVVTLKKGDTLYITISDEPGGMADIRLNGNKLSDRILVAGGGGSGGEGRTFALSVGSYTHYEHRPGGAGGIGGKYYIEQNNNVETVYLSSTNQQALTNYDNSQTEGSPYIPEVPAVYNENHHPLSWQGAHGEGGDGYAGGTEKTPGTGGLAVKASYGGENVAGGDGGGGGLSFINLDKVTSYSHLENENTRKATVQISLQQVKALTYDEALELINNIAGNTPCFTVLQNKPFSLRTTSKDMEEVTEGDVTITQGEIEGVYKVEGNITTPGWNYIDVGGKLMIFNVIEAPSSSNINVTFN